MTPKKIYISGKISGTDDYMQRFAEAENAVKKLFPEASVINPAKVTAALPEDTTYEQYMAMSFTMLDMCDTIYMMYGWEQSDGARLENSQARKLGLNILHQKTNKCGYCDAPIYIKTVQCAKPLLLPLTEAEELRYKLLDKTGEVYLQIPKIFCPFCGAKMDKKE